MKRHNYLKGAILAGCAAGLVIPSAQAVVSDEQFQALKDLVLKQGQKLEKLEGKHQQDEQIHQADQQRIMQLQHQLDETQSAATNALQKADQTAQAQAQAQSMASGPPATHNFTLAGDAEVIFGHVASQHTGFAMADYAPIFLYRSGDRTLFEAGFDFLLSDGSNLNGGNSGTAYNFDLSFATIDYLFNDYMTLVAGNMLLPLGTYSERSAGWLNKLPDNPLPRGLVPGNGLGAQLRGAVPIGSQGQMVTYAVYGVNGPSATDNSGTFGSLDLGGNVGILSNSRFGGATTFDSLGNIHNTPTGGGRVGWFYPWKAHYDIELGLSGQTGEWNDLGDTYSSFVVDGAIHISPSFELKGEYLRSWVGSSDMGTVSPSGWWVQAGYKLSGLNLDWPLVNNLELVGRYDTSTDILGAPDTKTSRFTIGAVYYLSNTLLFETDYEWLHTRGSAAGQVPANEILCQLSYGF